MKRNRKIGFSVGSILKPNHMIDFSRIIDENPEVDSVWVPESWGNEAFSLLGAISQVTNNIKIGTSIINVYTRTPATIAMGAITLNCIAEGRVNLGLGTSTDTLIESLHGLKFNKPLQRMKEYIESIRLLFKPDKIIYDGQIVKINNFKLLEPSLNPIPIFIAAVNKGMITLAGKYGDGILLYLKSKESLKKIINDLNNINSSNNFNRASIIITCVSNKEPEKAKKRVAKTLAFYIAVGNVYYQYFLKSKYKDIAEKIHHDYYKYNIERAAENITTEMLSDITIFGSVNDCNYQIKQFQKLGIELPILQVNPIKNYNGEMNYREFTEL